MSYSNIKRFLAVAMLLALATPSSFAIDSARFSTYVGHSTMDLNKGARLTDKNELITLSLRDSDVKQVLRMFADKAGLNIVLHDSVSGKVTLDLVQTPINEAFDLVLQISNLNYYKQGNTMIVMSKDAEDNATYSKQEMMVFPVKYVSAGKIADFLNKNVFGMKKVGMSGVDAATVNSATNELIVFGMPNDVAIIEKVIEQFDREPFSKTFAVNHTTPAEMANMICNVLLPSRGTENSGKSGGGKTTGGAADIGGSGDGIKLGEGILACSVSSTGAEGTIAPFDMQNISISYYPQRGTVTLMGGSPAQARMIADFIKAHDVKQPQAMLEISIVELNEEGSKDFNNQWEFQSRNWQATFNGDGLSGGRPLTGNNVREITQYYAPAPYIDKTTGQWKMDDEISRVIHTVLPSTPYIGWTMNYLIKNGKGRVLANPKIMITNGQTSTIDLTQDYVEKVTSEYLTSSVNGTGSTGTVQKNYTIGDDLGIKVELTPFISPEGYVTLNIKPDYSTVAEKVTSQGQVQGERDLVATLLSRRNLELKNVRIKDGETLIIGGLIQESEQKTVNKIPLLGDLPVVGSVFRSTSTSKAKSELVIMITPKIINDGDSSVSSVL